MTTLPCECSVDDVDWNTDTDDFEYDGECDLQPGECPCGNVYYRRYELIGITAEDGSLVADYTDRY